MANNVIIGFPDYTSDVSWSGGSWETNYPVENAGDVEQGRIARSTDLNAASLVLIGDFSQDRIARIFGLRVVNPTVTAQARIQLYDGAGATGTELHDSGLFDLFPRVFDLQQLEWEDNNFWSQSYTAEELAGQLWTRPYDVGSNIRVASFKITLSDSNNSDGYLDVAYISVANRWQLDVNPAYGANYGLTARSKAVQARGGAKTFDKLPSYRTWTGTVEFATRAEALQKAFEHQRRQGITDPFLWWPYPDEQEEWPRTVYLARNSQLSPLQQVIVGYDSFSLNIEEVL